MKQVRGFHIDADIPPVPQSATIRKIEPRFPNPFDVTTLKYAFAFTIRDYEPDVRQVGETRFLPFCAARIIRILERDPSGWWAGEVDGQQGWFWYEFVTAVHTSRPGEDLFMRYIQTVHEQDGFRPGNQPHDGADRDVHASTLDSFIRALSQLNFALNHRTCTDLQSMSSNIKASVHSVLDIDRSLNRNKALSALTGLTRMIEDPDPHEVEIRGVSVNHTDVTLGYAHILFLSLRSFAYSAIFGRPKAYSVSATEYRVWTSLPSSTMSSHGIEPRALFNSVYSPGYLPYFNRARWGEDVGWARGRTRVTMTIEFNSRSDRLSRISEGEDEDASEDEDELYEDGGRDSYDQWEVDERNESDNAEYEENVDEEELNYNAAAAALAETSPSSTSTSSGTTWTSYGSIWFARTLTVSSSNSLPQFSPPQFSPPQFLPFHSPRTPPQFLPFHSPPQVSPFHSPPQLSPFHSPQQFSTVFYSPQQFATFHSLQEMSP